MQREVEALLKIAERLNDNSETVAAASEDVNSDLRRQVVAGGDDTVTPVYGRASAVCFTEWKVHRRTFYS